MTMCQRFRTLFGFDWKIYLQAEKVAEDSSRLEAAARIRWCGCGLGHG